MINRVALYGPMCSGKTYMADHLVNGYGFQKLSFATRLKELAAELYGVERKDAYARKIYQALDCLRQIDENVWINVVLNQLKDYKTPYVIDDLRLRTESRALRKAGFTLIQVDCAEEVRRQRIAFLYPNTSKEAQKHSTETDWVFIMPDHRIWSNSDEDFKILEEIIDGTA